MQVCAKSLAVHTLVRDLLVLAGLDGEFLALDEQAALRNHLNILMKPNAALEWQAGSFG